VTTLATVTDEMVTVTIAMPHGWGHRGSWRRANAAGGATSNLLSSEVEAASGSSVLNGIPVRIKRVAGGAAVSTGDRGVDEVVATR